MTDQDNLRNRIAEVIFNAGMQPAERVAQAIIDDLELTTETHAATHAKRTMTRITGAREWDNQ